MSKFRLVACAFWSALVLASATSLSAAEYAIDEAHTSLTFKASHLGLSWTHGRFDDVTGNFSFDEAKPEDAAFKLVSKIDSIDTNNKKRDEHLRSPDFFNAKQFPALTYASKSVKAVKGGWEVTGDLTMHGVTKPVTFVLTGGKAAEFPKGTKRIGFSTEFKLKRSDFGMDKMLEAIGDEVHVSISFEGTSK
jgi:polyisoprenoid-binding protein YceI